MSNKYEVEVQHNGEDTFKEYYIHVKKSGDQIQARGKVFIKTLLNCILSAILSVIASLAFTDNSVDNNNAKSILILFIVAAVAVCILFFQSDDINEKSEGKQQKIEILMNIIMNIIRAVSYYMGKIYNYCKMCFLTLLTILKEPLIIAFLYAVISKLINHDSLLAFKNSIVQSLCIIFLFIFPFVIALLSKVIVNLGAFLNKKGEEINSTQKK